MHEIGHTLGLRHNFKASTQLSLEDINNPEKIRRIGDGLERDGLLSGQRRSPGRQARGLLLADDRRLRHVGHRIWLQADPASDRGSELPELKKIASRSGEPGLCIRHR